jgi:ankyrin repeat protein
VKFLLSAGADAKLVDNRGKPALEIADEAGHLDAKNNLITPCRITQTKTPAA